MGTLCTLSIYGLKPIVERSILLQDWSYGDRFIKEASPVWHLANPLLYVCYACTLPLPNHWRASTSEARLILGTREDLRTVYCPEEQQKASHRGECRRGSNRER
jgi:hypothetical protein